MSFASTAENVHPLRLSLCEIEYKRSDALLLVNLKLFLTDVNEALVFDPYSKQLRFCEADENERAELLLLNYLEKYFYIKVNGVKLPLVVKSKRLSGEGDNTALWVLFECKQIGKINTMEIKDNVFTDLFFDQSNLVYVHVNDKTLSLMLNKKTPTHKIDF